MIKRIVKVIKSKVCDLDGHVRQLRGDDVYCSRCGKYLGKQW